MPSNSHRRRGSTRRAAAEAAAAASALPPVALFPVRASTPDQVNSLEAQRAEGAAYAAAHGFEMLPEGGSFFVDAGVSAAECDFADRPQAQACLARAAALRAEGRPAIIIFTKIDRAFRSQNDLFATLDAWEREGIRWACPQLGVDPQSPLGRLLVGMLGALAEFERAIMLERQAAANAIARRDGQALSNHAPYGWRFDPTGDGKQLTPDIAEQATLRAILGLYRKGESFAAIARCLNAAGIPTKRGAKRWRSDSVESVIDHARLDDSQTAAAPLRLIA